MVTLQVGTKPTADAAGIITVEPDPVEETCLTRYLPNTDRPTLGKRRVGQKESKTIYKNIQQIRNKRRNNTLENYAKYIFLLQFYLWFNFNFFSFLSMVIMISARKKKKIEFQHILWANSSLILLAPGSYNTCFSYM